MEAVNIFYFTFFPTDLGLQERWLVYMPLFCLPFDKFFQILVQDGCLLPLPFCEG